MNSLPSGMNGFPVRVIIEFERCMLVCAGGGWGVRAGAEHKADRVHCECGGRHVLRVRAAALGILAPRPLRLCGLQRPHHR